jgi:hypothetical protein
MGILIPLVFSVFFYRDFFLLGLASARSLWSRLGFYAATLLASVLLAPMVIAKFEVGWMHSFTFALFCGLFYAALLGLCFWLRRCGLYNLVWLTALPNPVLIGSIIIFAPTDLRGGTQYSVFLVLAWIGAMSVGLLATRSTTPIDPESDASLELAGVMNLAAMVILPVDALLTRVNP